MAISLPKLQPMLLKQLPYEVQEWIRQLQNLIVAASGTVTSVSVTTANGVSGSVATPTSTPVITLTLGAITPSSVASTGVVSGTNLSGTNTGDVNDATITTTDVTTNNVGTTKHGWAPKAPNDATKYLDGTGAYSVPAGSGGGTNLRGTFFSSLAANQTGLTAGAYNQVKVDTEAFDIDNWLDSTTNKGRYTPQVAGKYWFSGFAVATATAGDSPEASLYKNGGTTKIHGTYNPVGGGAGGIVWSVVTGLIDMNGTTDYVELYCYLPATVTAVQGGNTFQTNFQGFRVST